MTSRRKATSVERFFTRSPFSIVTMVARIKGNVTEEMLRNAVGKIQQRHFLLRVRIIDDDNHEQRFATEGVQEIPIEIVARKSENDWIDIHAESMKIPFDFETRPAIRLILVQSADVSELIILCHHMICDGVSLAYLARDLMVYLGDPACQVEVLPVPPTIGLDNLPTDVSQSGLAKFFINRMNQKWIEDSEFFDHEDYKTLTKAYWDTFHHKFFSIELTEAETSALVARCRKENVTVNSALTAAFTGAQSFVEGEKPYHAKVVVAASLRDRLPNPPEEGMGMYASGVELKFKYNHKKTFWENARTFHKKIQPRLTTHLQKVSSDAKYYNLTFDKQGNPNDETVLSGPFIDQSALFGTLNKIHSLNLTLISGNRIVTETGSNQKGASCVSIPKAE